MSTLGKALVSIASVVIVALIGVLIYCYWPAITGTVNETKYYTADEVQEAYDKGFADGNKSEIELQAKYDYYKSLVDDYYIQVNTLNGEITKLNAENTDYVTRITTLTTQKTSLEEQVDNLTTIKTNNENTIADLNSQVVSLKSQVTALTNSNEDKTEQIASLNTQIANLQNTISQLQTTNDMNLQTITSLNTQIANLNTQISDMTMQSQNSTSQINALNNKINELQTSINYYESYIASLETGEQVVATFEFDGSVYNIQIVNKGAKVSVVDPTSTDYVIFNYWTVDGEQIDLATYTLNTNTKIVANVTYKYDVKFVVDGANHDSQVVTQNACPTLPSNPTKDGYDFDGWTLNGVDVVSDIDTTPITQNTTYTAKFTKLHTVTFVVDGETVSTQTVRNGNYVSNIPSVDNTTEKVFNGWKINEIIVDLSSYKIVSNTMIVADITNYYNVTFMIDDNVHETKLMGDNECVMSSLEPTKDGYTFVGWSLDCNNVINNNYKIFGDTTLYAMFNHILTGRWTGSDGYDDITFDIYPTGIVHVTSIDSDSDYERYNYWTYIKKVDDEYCIVVKVGTANDIPLTYNNGQLIFYKPDDNFTFIACDTIFEYTSIEFDVSYLTPFSKLYNYVGTTFLGEPYEDIYEITMSGTKLFIQSYFNNITYSYCIVIDGKLYAYYVQGLADCVVSYDYELTDEYLIIDGTTYTFVEES